MLDVDRPTHRLLSRARASQQPWRRYCWTVALLCFAIVANCLLLTSTGLGQSTERFRDFGRSGTPTPEELFRKLAKFRQISPEDTVVVDQLQKLGRDIFESLSPEEQRQAKQFAEQLIRNKGLESEEARSLMDRMGVAADTQQELIRQFRASGSDDLLSGSGQAAELQRKIEELDRVAGVDLRSILQGATDRSTGGKREPTGNDQARESRSPKSAPELFEPASEFEPGSNPGAGREEVTSDNPAVAPGDPMGQWPLDLPGDRTLPRPEEDQNNPERPSSTTSNSTGTEPGTEPNSSDGSISNKDTEVGAESTAANDPGRNGQATERASAMDGDRGDSPGTPDLNSPTVDSTVRAGAGDDEAWARNFYEYASQALPELKRSAARGELDQSDLTSERRDQMKRMARELMKNRGADGNASERNAGLGDWMKQGAEMLSGAAPAPVKEKLEARFDRMLVEAAKSSLEAAAEDQDKTAVSKALESVVDAAYGAAKRTAAERRRRLAENRRESPDRTAERSSTDGDDERSDLAQAQPSTETSPFAADRDAESAIPDDEAENPVSALAGIQWSWWWWTVGTLLLVVGIGMALHRWKPDSWGSDRARQRHLARVLRTASLRSPRDFVDAVDLYLLTHHGPQSNWWSSSRARRAVETEVPADPERIAQLFRAYTQSRYAARAELGETDRRTAESTLRDLVATHPRPSSRGGRGGDSHEFRIQVEG